MITDLVNKAFQHSLIRMLQLQEYQALENGQAEFLVFFNLNLIYFFYLAKYDFVGSGGFIDSVDRRTMELDKNQGGVLALLASHDYLGYSVLYGRFGFWHEDERNFTVKNYIFKHF